MIQERLGMKVAIFAIALVLTGCGDRSGAVSYRVVEEFSKESLFPHSLGSRALFLKVGGTNFCRLAGVNTNSVQLVDGGKALVFFSIDEKLQTSFQLLGLFDERHVQIPIGLSSWVGAEFGRPVANGRGAEILSITHSNVVIRSHFDRYEEIYDFNTDAGTFNKSSSKLAE